MVLIFFPSNGVEQISSDTGFIGNKCHFSSSDNNLHAFVVFLIQFPVQRANIYPYMLSDACSVNVFVTAPYHGDTVLSLLFSTLKFNQKNYNEPKL